MLLLSTSDIVPPRLLPDTRLGSEEQPCSPTAANTLQIKTTERFMIIHPAGR